MEFSIGEFRPIAPDVYVATCQPAGVNVGLVIGSQRAALIDTGSSSEQGAQLLAAARELSPVPVTHAIITHHHWDHWFGLAGMPEVTGVGHENLATVEQPEQQVEWAATARLPEERFNMAKGLELGELRMELLNFGDAHTNNDVMVWIPSRNVCFAGDMLEESGDPQFSEDSSVQNWPTALDGILGAANDETVFVPGHGAMVDRMFAFRQRAEIGMLYSQCEMLIEQGVKLKDAAASTEWPFLHETLDVALPLIYGQLEAKGIKPRTHLPLI